MDAEERLGVKIHDQDDIAQCEIMGEVDAACTLDDRPLN